MSSSGDARRGDASAGRFAAWLNRLADGASALVLFALMAMTCIDVIGRYFFNAPLDGATELTQLMLGVVVFAVLPAVCLREEHISVDLLDRWFPTGLGAARSVVLNFLMAVMMAAVCWRVWLLAELTADYGDATEFLAIPLAPITYFIAVLSGCAAAAFAANVVRHLGHCRPGRQAGRFAP